MPYIPGSGAGNTTDASGTALAATLGAAVAVGDYIVGGFGWGSTTIDISTIVDDLGNTYTLESNQLDSAGSQATQTFRCRVTVAGTPTVTVTLGTAAPFRSLVIAGYDKMANPANEGALGADHPTPGLGYDASPSPALYTGGRNRTVIAIQQNISGTVPVTDTQQDFQLRIASGYIRLADMQVIDGPKSVKATWKYGTNAHCASFVVVLAPDSQIADVEYGKFPRSIPVGMHRRQAR